jgi:hypothetical protein
VIPPASSPPVGPDAGQETPAGPARTGGRVPWRAAGIGLTSLGTPVGIGVSRPPARPDRDRDRVGRRARDHRHGAVRQQGPQRARLPPPALDRQPARASRARGPRGYPFPCMPVTGRHRQAAARRPDRAAWCLTVFTDAVITWTTEYYQIAVQDLRAKGPGRARAEHELDVARAELVPLRREPEPTQTPASGRRRRSG